MASDVRGRSAVRDGGSLGSLRKPALCLVVEECEHRIDQVGVVAQIEHPENIANPFPGDALQRVRHLAATLSSELRYLVLKRHPDTPP